MRFLKTVLKKTVLKKASKLFFTFFNYTKMSYYRKNKEVLLEKAYDKYHNKGGKERVKKYYQANKEKIKEKERLKYWFMHEPDREKIRERSLGRYYRMKSK